MDKRSWMRIVGGGVILAAAGGGTFLATRTPTQALRPWREAGVGYTEPRRRALSFAILAPNPHNRQPWQVDLSVPDRVTVFADPQRQLPHTDPFSRQITIGLGCFIELMAMAAAADGWAVDCALFPEGADPARLDHRPVAVATFRRAAASAPDPLFGRVLERRTSKEPFDLARPVAPERLDRLVRAATEGAAPGLTASGTVDPARIAALRRLTHEALVTEIDTPRTYRESVDLFRIGRREIEAAPDGIDLGGPMIDTLAGLGLMSREAALDRSSATFTQGRDAVLAACDTAMGHLWIVTAQNRRVDQIAAGRAWMRTALAATAAGVGIHPLSQALQEFPEMRPWYLQAHRTLAPDGGTVQMLARLGHSAPVPASPRWPLETRILG